MAAYGVAHLRNVSVGPEIVEYLMRIDATLAPFGGRFIIHGGYKQVVEGNWEGELIVIRFPDRESVHVWYRSQAYQDILHLRVDHSVGDVIIVDGVPDDHKAIDVLG